MRAPPAWRAALLAAASGCVKPLVLLDAAAEAQVDSSSAEVSLADAPAEASDDGGAEAGDAEAPTPTCAAMPLRRDCAHSVVDRTVQSFCLGATPSPSSALDVAPELCGVMVEPFEVDQSEVSVGRFDVFRGRVQRGEVPAQLTVSYPRGVRVAVNRPDLSSAAQQDTGPGCNWVTGTLGIRELHPMNCVSYDVAQYFCASEGGRLPTRAEFEYLTRYWGAGPAGSRQYPWGHSGTGCEYALLSGCVGSNSRNTRRINEGMIGAARNEVFNLAGNVAEWVADRFDTYTDLPRADCWTRDGLCLPTAGMATEVRGGSYSSPADFALSLSRASAPSTPSPERGFRCVYPRP